MKRELFVGGLFALILSLLLATTLYVNDPGVFAKGDERYRMTARFRDVSGLTEITAEGLDALLCLQERVLTEGSRLEVTGLSARVLRLLAEDPVHGS